MWNFAKKFIPGMQSNLEKDDAAEEISAVQGSDTKETPFHIEESKPEVESDGSFGSCEFSDVIVRMDEEEDNEDQEFYITNFRPKKKPPPEIIAGADWESVNYKLSRIPCREDEITGIEVSNSYVVAQYYIEPTIDVFDRESGQRVFSLCGHEYGGGNLSIVEDRYLYSGSMDRSIICWDLKGNEEDKKISSAQDHYDYVNTLFASESYVVSGGRGDKLVFVYEPLALNKKFKLEGHSGWINSLTVMGDTLFSGSEDGSFCAWNLNDGSLLKIYEEDAGISCALSLTQKSPLIIYGDSDSKMSILDLESEETHHLLPNILIGTGRYCRSCKYHDKGIDNIHLTENGFLITASSGSKFIKIWKFFIPPMGNLELIDVKELQILRDHGDYLTALRVFENKIYSSCSDGCIYVQEFPEGSRHYDMAEEQESDAVNVASLTSNGALLEAPKTSTELCLGRSKCRTGKSGVVKSSSSFMVSFQLKPPVAQVKESIRLPSSIPEEPDEWNPNSDTDYDSDEYEVVFVSESEEDL